MVRALVVLLVLLGFAAPAEAGYVFRWVDKNGDLHVTDRLGDVPEPYHSMYAAQIRRLEEQRAKGKGKVIRPVERPSPRPSASDPAPSFVEKELARQKHWRDLVARWRKELSTTTGELEKINQELAQARLNPILRTTPPVKAKIAEIEKRRALVVEKVNAARTMLMKTIPERARKEQVPPKWIM